MNARNILYLMSVYRISTCKLATQTATMSDQEKTQNNGSNPCRTASFPVENEETGLDLSLRDKSMKKSLPIVGTLIVILTFAAQAPASTPRDPGAITADVLLARPFCLAATVVGSAVFVVALPVAVTSGSVHSTAHALVVTPAWATFSRPLGDFAYPEDYAVQHPAKHVHPRIAQRAKDKPRTANPSLHNSG